MLSDYQLCEVHSAAQTTVLSCMQHVLAELLLIASRSSLAGREHSILDVTRGRISGAFSGLR